MLAFQSCKPKKGEVVFIENKTFSTLNSEYGDVSSIAQNILRKKHKITKIKVNNFENLSNDLTKIFQVKKNVILFVEPFIAPLVIHWGEDKSITCKIVTYGFKGDISNSDFPVFNISGDEKILFDSVKSFITNNTRKNKETVVFIESGNSVSSGLDKTLNNIEGVKILSLYQNNEISQFKSAIENKKIKNIVLFSGIGNRVINTIDEKMLYHKKILEVVTEYGRINKLIGTHLSIDYSKIVKEGLTSPEFESFCITEFNKKTIVNYKSKSSKSFKFSKNIKKLQL